MSKFCRDNGIYFVRDDCHRNAGREYPKEVYPFGNTEIELFLYETDHIWRAIEKKAGLLVADG